MNIKKTKTVLLVLVLALTLTTIVKANDGFNVPLGAENATTIRSETSNTTLYPAYEVPAIAGNLTELNITGVAQTKSWQGFFGNVSGTIILEDSSGMRFYDWSAAEPQGQVYASVNNTISWTTVECADIDNPAFRTPWYTFYGMLDTDYDNINITYSFTGHPEFYVGFETINGCRTTYTFVEDERQTVPENEMLFPAVLLADENDALIFTAILEDRTIGERRGRIGYDGGDYDFQLLVAENGQQGNDDTTPYFFWIEIH